MRSPCQSLVPLLVLITTEPAVVRPNSAAMLHRKLANYIGRKILQESADVVVGVVHAIDRELICRSGPNLRRAYRRDAPWWDLGRLNWLRTRNHVGDVGKLRAASRMLAGPSG